MNKLLNMVDSAKRKKIACENVMKRMGLEKKNVRTKKKVLIDVFCIFIM